MSQGQIQSSLQFQKVLPVFEPTFQKKTDTCLRAKKIKNRKIFRLSNEKRIRIDGQIRFKNATCEQSNILNIFLNRCACNTD